MQINSIITNTEDFTCAIGQFFRAGTRFQVVQVGSVNSRAMDLTTGSLVWIANHKAFFTGQGW
jgi:hypothetical protein